MESQQTLKVLVGEDNLSDRRFLESMLFESPHSIALLKSSDSLAGVLTLLEQYEFDVVILDLNLIDSYGEATLLELNKKFPSVAVVVNTGAFEDELGLEALSFGAQDFLVKGKYDSYTLKKALYYAVERKRIEFELVSANQKIKDTQSQLIQSEKMKVVGGLASGVAHEVKNPLATLLYGVTYLSKNLSESNSKIDSILGSMKEAINRANDIITDLLNFSSLTSLTKRSENLENVIKKSIDLVRHEFLRNKISVITHVDKLLPEIKVDRNRIEQVLINLILNSVHSMPDGGDIILSAHSRLLSEDLEDVPQLRRDVFKSGEVIVIFTVEDQGCGIPNDKVDQIFDPFFTTRRGSGGVGLGLSVSKNIMDIHKGSIFIENKKDGGARATLIFKAESVMRGGFDEQAKNLNYR